MTKSAWICPQCNGVMAPFMPHCTFCQPTGLLPLTHKIIHELLLKARCYGLTDDERLQLKSHVQAVIATIRDEE